MHLNKILEQIKRHQSPSEAIDKLSTALEKHEGSLLEKGFTILKSELAKAWLCDKDIDEGKMWHYYVYLMCDDDENDYKAYERMHGSHSYRSPEYEHRMGRERGYDYEARSYQYPYSRYDREELDRDSKRYREDDRERMEREREMRDRGLRSTRETRNTSLLQQQTSNIVSQIKPCPVPAYLTCNPYGCNGGLNGYGYGYPYGYGDSCCA